MGDSDGLPNPSLASAASDRAHQCTYPSSSSGCERCRRHASIIPSCYAPYATDDAEDGRHSIQVLVLMSSHLAHSDQETLRCSSPPAAVADEDAAPAHNQLAAALNEPLAGIQVEAAVGTRLGRVVVRWPRRQVPEHLRFHQSGLSDLHGSVGSCVELLGHHF